MKGPCTVHNHSKNLLNLWTLKFTCHKKVWQNKLQESIRLFLQSNDAPLHSRENTLIYMPNVHLSQ